LGSRSSFWGPTGCKGFRLEGSRFDGGYGLRVIWLTVHSSSFTLYNIGHWVSPPRPPPAAWHGCRSASICTDFTVWSAPALPSGAPRFKISGLGDVVVCGTEFEM
jgi:hypothetical protein